MNATTDLGASEDAPGRSRFGRWLARFRGEAAAEPDATGSDEIDALIDRAARWVVDRRLETPAVLFLEAHKPFSFLASQGLVVGTPFLAPLFGLERVEGFSRMLESSANVDRLIDRIEDLAEAG